MTITNAGVLYEPPIDLRVLVETVETRLQALDLLKVYAGEVPPESRLPKDTDGRVLPYCVVWPNMPAPAADTDLGDCAVDREWSLQVTVAAGWMPTLLDRAEQVHQHLYRWAPSYTLTVGGTTRTVVCSGLQVPPGYQPPVLPDRDTSPLRHYVPLQYRTTATA